MVDTEQRVELISALEKILREEIILMRHMLTSLHEENEAILSSDLHLVERVMEDRLGLIESFERVGQEALTLICHLEEIEEIEFSQELAIEHLQAILKDDDLELQSLLQQRSEILKEIYSRNYNNSVLLIQNPLRVIEEHHSHQQYANPLSVTYGPNQKRLAKQALQVLDPKGL